MKTIPLLAALLAGACLPAAARNLQCSVHPQTGASAAALQAMAKVTHNDAQQRALSAYGKLKVNVSEGELEAENGCLVYSFDIRVPGQSGVDEVLVDAGSGKVLERNHETPMQEKTEAAVDMKQPKS